MLKNIYFRHCKMNFTLYWNLGTAKLGKSEQVLWHALQNNRLTWMRTTSMLECPALCWQSMTLRWYVPCLFSVCLSLQFGQRFCSGNEIWANCIWYSLGLRLHCQIICKIKASFCYVDCVNILAERSGVVWWNIQFDFAKNYQLFGILSCKITLKFH